MITLEFPSQEDIQKIYSTTSFDELNALLFRLHSRNDSEDNFNGLTGLKQLLDSEGLIWQLHNRLMDVAKSYVLLSYFFEKGIPDDIWFISPGKRDSSIEYFPHFEPIHFMIKDWFDYYSGIFYQQLFSTLDVVGHLLNVQYSLGVSEKKVSFRGVVNRLERHNNSLYVALDQVRSSPVFLEATQLRNNITHNHLPSSTGLTGTLTENGGNVNIQDYMTSDKIFSNVREIIGLLEEVITLVTR